MATEFCYGFVCFISLDANGPKIFGISEFLAGLALMVLAWTTADVLYRFRIAAAPLPLRMITFYVVAAVGVLTLLTDLWRAEGWLVPKGSLLTPSEWQAILGGLYIATFLSWAWFAFIMPPIYGRRNAKRYAQALYKFVLKGSTTELSVIADELSYSARNLVLYATDFSKQARVVRKSDTHDEQNQVPTAEDYADDLLLLIADKKFCRAIVQSSPGTALAFFQAVGEQKKYGIQIETFAKNIVAEALENTDSFLYHETDGYESGLLGYHKPLSQAMFADYKMVEGVGTLLTPDILGQWKWDAYKWKAYCRIVLMVFSDKIDSGVWGPSFSLSQALRHIGEATYGLYKINGMEKYVRDEEEQEKLRVIVDFIGDAILLLNKKEMPVFLPLRITSSRRGETIYDEMARVVFSVIFSAARVQSPAGLCWTIQHNYVWGELTGFKLEGEAGKIIEHKLRRLIYDEIVNIGKFQNYKSAVIIGYCLNVVGFIPRGVGNGHENILRKIVSGWAKKNYALLCLQNPSVAEACLVDSITYDAERYRLIKTYSTNALRQKPRLVYLQLNPPLNNNG